MRKSFDQIKYKVARYKLQLPILTSWLVVGCPGAQAVVGVEVHGVVLLLPDDLLQSNSRLVGGEDGGVEGQTPVYAQSDKTNRNQC